MLHDEQVNLIVDVWTSIKGYIEKKERFDAASSLLRSLENHYEMEGICEELLGTDAVLDTVIKEMYLLDDGAEDDYDEDNYDFED
jgi:hypothetical protein